ncbi:MULTISPECIES: DNA primase [Aeribacillus]|uniref:DNA primase n=2 Tax=Aeribacillus TaxID=1055323 RepID=A0A165XQE4_9BACI|nr:MULTISPECIES: DNA primase [Aeribacillus]KZN96293.1 DNA primase [Aeribacillus pallidus]MDR9793335.1 DNA primase [Aeribacillus pallidus]WNF32155.1 DNA primase [Aeribacillus composti]
MGKMLPEEFIEKVQHAVDIVDVVSEYVQLKKQGRNFFGLCPFHGENTPSFSVSPEKQIFHCFGCGSGGNVFTFLMQIEGCSFTEAVQMTAKKAGLDIPGGSALSQESTYPNNSEAEKMIKVHELLKKMYHHLLLNTKEGQNALNYLLHRGFTKELIDQFEIGYALDSWDFSLKYLLKKGFELPLLEKTGLIIRSESNGSFFDRFRNRIMFPVKDAQGRTVAFSGRSLGNKQPKYLNSPETKIFNKGRILYNFHQARPFIRRKQEAVLFEGFADVISSVHAGIEHSVATMGTALTEEQVKLLARSGGTVVICYDSDSAGIEAAFRASKLLVEAGCNVRIAKMPEGLDPDDYIRTYGKEKFKNDVIGASLSLMAFKMEYFRKGKNLQDEGDRARYIQEVLNELSSLPSGIEQELYITQLSEEFSVLKETLMAELRNINKRKRRRPEKTSLKTDALQRNALMPAYQKAERLLIAHMLKSREVAEKVLHAIGGNFNVEEHRAISSYLYAYYEEGNDPDISHFLTKLKDPSLSRIVSEIAMMTIGEQLTEQELQDYVKHILNHQKMLILKEKEAEKKEAEKRKDYVKAAEIAMEVIQLKKGLM